MSSRKFYIPSSNVCGWLFIQGLWDNSMLWIWINLKTIWFYRFMALWPLSCVYCWRRCASSIRFVFVKCPYSSQLTSYIHCVNSDKKMNDSRRSMPNAEEEDLSETVSRTVWIYSSSSAFILSPYFSMLLFLLSTCTVARLGLSRAILTGSRRFRQFSYARFIRYPSTSHSLLLCLFQKWRHQLQ